ncbi:hypothetical protein DFS33DRAFT_670241 [Desarmillaria ectypa]|nr:hypothetical protein DFS33DRAFT_670241 [Desarmillaria ectypa]
MSVSCTEMVEVGIEESAYSISCEESCAPPPYERGWKPPPAYTPPCLGPPLVKYLCLFGFLCPLLWIIGSLALCLPLQHIFPWLFAPRRRNIDSDVLSQRIRRTEIRWASVCLILTSILFFVGAFVLIIKLYL